MTFESDYEKKELELLNLQIQQIKNDIALQEETKSNDEQQKRIDGFRTFQIQLDEPLHIIQAVMKLVDSLHREELSK